MRWILKHRPEDFRVSECLTLRLKDSAEGSRFTYLSLTKSGYTTFAAAAKVAAAVGLEPVKIGHAGLKDEDVPQSVRDYIDRHWAREAVREGMKVPNGNTDWVEKMRSPDFFEVHAKEAEEKAAQASKWIQDGMKKDRESKA